MPLLWVLRDILGMTGTKFGCGHRAVRRLHRAYRRQAGALLRACRSARCAIAPSPPSKAWGATQTGAKVQKAWLALEVVQCGYCQFGPDHVGRGAAGGGPPIPDDSDIDAAMAGNICRCGTYVRIRAAIKQAASGKQS